MKTTKLSPTAPGLVEIDGQLYILAAETVTIEYGEFHSVKTGTAIQVPDGSIGLLAETQPMGQRGVTVTGTFVTSLDLSELRVGILNNSRNAFTVTAGTPVARLVILTVGGETLEDTSADDWAKLVADAKEKRNEEAAKLHGDAVTNSPATAGTTASKTGTGLDTRVKPDAASVNADAKAKAEGKTVVPSEVEAANKAKAEAEAKAKDQKEKEDAAAKAKPSPAPGVITGDITTK